MIKKLLLISIMLLIFINFICATGEIYENNYVYIDNEMGYINITPSTRTNSGFINYEFISKNFSGNVNILFGVNNDNLNLKSLYLYEPYSYDFTNQYIVTPTFFNTTSLECDRWSGNNHYLVNTIVYCIDSYDNLGNGTYILYDNITINKDYNKITNVNNYNFSYRNLTNWFEIENISINIDEINKGKFFLNILNNNGKYDIYIYPSIYNITEAFEQNKIFFIDPYYNLTSNLMAYYLFDTSANDSINNYDGIVSGATLTSGKINNSYVFDGSFWVHSKE